MTSPQHPLAPLSASAAPIAGHAPEPGSGDDVENASGARTRALNRFQRGRARMHYLWARHKRWLWIAIPVFLFLCILAAILSTTLTLGTGRAKYAAWEREHAYDSPIHPMIGSNWPDPAWMFYKGDTSVFGTNDAAGILSPQPGAYNKGFGEANIQLGVVMDDENHWSFSNTLDQPLPRAGAWADSGMTRATIQAPSISRANGWSPGIIQRKTDKRFVLYYAAAMTPLGSNESMHCIGAAVSPAKSPRGPFKPLDRPLVCDVERGGAIDPSPFRDKDGAMWLVYKVDGNHIGHGGRCNNMKEPIVPTPIMLQRMLKDGVSPDGSAIQIFDRTAEDGPLVEAPDIVRSKEGIYFLFFSSGCTRDESYDIKYATSEDITGPYVRASRKLLRSGDWSLDAPGSPSVIQHPTENSWLMAFHSRKPSILGRVRAASWTRLYLDGRRAQVVNDVELSRILMPRH